MGQIVAFPGHRWHRCAHAECPWCAAGWLYCEVCEGASTSRAPSSLTANCCGVLLSAAVLDDVRYRRRDFRCDHGWFAPAAEGFADEPELLSDEELEAVANDLLDA